MEDSDQIFPDIQVCISYYIALYLIAQRSRLSTHPGLTLDIGKSHLEDALLSGGQLNND